MGDVVGIAEVVLLTRAGWCCSAGSLQWLESLRGHYSPWRLTG